MAIGKLDFGNAKNVKIDDAEAFMILDGDGEIVFKKNDFDSVVMIYKDQSKPGGLGFQKYSIEETGRDLSVCDITNPFQVIPPYSDTVQDKKNIVAFIDGTSQISSLNQYCFYGMNQLTSLNLPGVTSAGIRSLESISGLKNINISSITSFQNSINSPVLNHMFIDSDSYKSIGNGYGDEDQLIMLASDPERYMYSATPGTQRISNDNIISSYGLNHIPALMECHLKNLSATANTGDFSLNSPKLISVDIDNAYWKSISDGVTGRRNLIVHPVGDGKLRLDHVLYSANYISNDNIISIGMPGGMERLTYLISVSINNDYFKTSEDHGDLFDSTGKKLILHCPQAPLNCENLSNVEQLGPYSLHQLRTNKGLKDLSLPNVKTIMSSALMRIGYNGAVSSLTFENATEVKPLGFYLTDVKLISARSLKNAPERCFASYTGNGNLISIDAPNLSAVGTRCFFANLKLPSLHLPNCTQVGNEAFRECESLSSVNLDSCPKSGFGKDLFLYNKGAMKELFCRSITKEELTSIKDHIALGSDCSCYCSDGDVIP